MELAEDITARLRAEELLEVFAALPPSHQREYVSWIDEAKKPDTRKKRIIAMCVLVADRSNS